MTNAEVRPEGYQLSFAEAFLDSLKWGNVNTEVSISQFLQYLKGSCIDENIDIFKAQRRKILQLTIPLRKGQNHSLSRMVTFATDGEEPERNKSEIIYTPKTYLAWILRTPKENGYYKYSITVDTILRGRFDSLQSSLQGEESPLIPNITLIRPLIKETKLKPTEETIQAAFVIMPKAS